MRDERLALGAGIAITVEVTSRNLELRNAAPQGIGSRVLPFLPKLGTLAAEQPPISQPRDEDGTCRVCHLRSTSPDLSCNDTK